MFFTYNERKDFRDLKKKKIFMYSYTSINKHEKKVALFV